MKDYTLEDIKNKLINIIHDICKTKMQDPNMLDMSSNIDFKNDLAFDSLDFIDLIFQVEEAFKIQIPEENTQSILSNLVSLTGYIHDKMSEE